MLFILILSISAISAEDTGLNDEDLVLNEVSEDVSLDSSDDVSLDSSFDIKDEESSIGCDNLVDSYVADKKLMDSEDYNEHITVDFCLSYPSNSEIIYTGDPIYLGICFYDDEENWLSDNVTVEIYDNSSVLVCQNNFFVDGIDPYYTLSSISSPGKYSATIFLENYKNITFKYDAPVFEVFERPVYNILILNESVVEDGYFIMDNNNVTIRSCGTPGELMAVEINDCIELEFPSYDSEGYCVINIPNLKKGENNIRIFYPGNPSGEVDDFVVIPASIVLYGYDEKTYLNVDIKDVIEGNDFIFNASLTDENGTIINKTFSLQISDETDYENVIEDEYNITGSQTITLDKKYIFGGHQYNVSAVYEGDNYTLSPSRFEGDFNAWFRYSSIELGRTIFNDDNDIELSFFAYNKLNESIAGVINFTLNNKSYSLQVDNETGGSINVGKLEFGNYTLSARFDTDDYHFSLLNETICVLKSTKLLVEADDVAPGESGTIDFTLKTSDNQLINATMELYIYNAFGDYLVYCGSLNLSDSKASYILDNVSETYFIQAVCCLNEDYEDTVGYGSIKLIEKLPSIDLALNEAADSVIVSLKDSEGNPISNASLEADVAGKTSNLTTDAKGQANFPIGANETAKVVYTDANSQKVAASIVNNVINNTIENNITVYVNVTPNRTATKIAYANLTTTAVAKVDGRVGEYFKVTLQDAQGKALANKLVQIGFNGKVYNRTTNSTGGAELQINLGNAGKYTFAIAFLGDDDYNGSFEVALITVNKHSPKLTAPAKSFKSSAKTKTLTATFKSANGNAISGKKISFTINGKTYTATTNSKGIASVKISLSKKGTYTATAKYAGDDMYKTTSTKFSVKIK